MSATVALSTLIGVSRPNGPIPVETYMEKLLTSQDVKRMFHVSDSTLSRWREDGRGSRFLNLNGIIRYTHDDLREYIDGNRT